MDYIFYNSISDKSFPFSFDSLPPPPVLPLHNSAVNIMIKREESFSLVVHSLNSASYSLIYQYVRYTDGLFYNSITDKSFSFSFDSLPPPLVIPLHNAVVNIMVVREESFNLVVHSLNSTSYSLIYLYLKVY